MALTLRHDKFPCAGHRHRLRNDRHQQQHVDGKCRWHGGGGVMQKPSIYRSTSFSNPMHPIYKTSELTIAGQKPRRGMPMIMATT